MDAADWQQDRWLQNNQNWWEKRPNNNQDHNSEIQKSNVEERRGQSVSTTNFSAGWKLRNCMNQFLHFTNGKIAMWEEKKTIQNRPQFRHNKPAFIEDTKCCSHSFTNTPYLNPESSVTKKGTNTVRWTTRANPEETHADGQPRQSQWWGRSCAVGKGRKDWGKTPEKTPFNLPGFSVIMFSTGIQKIKI